MPITKLQFKMGIDGRIEALMVAVYNFLKEHQNTAYAEEELFHQFGTADPGTYIDTSCLDIALQKIVETGAAEARPVANATYFAFVQEIDKNTWKPVSEDRRNEHETPPAK